MGILGTSLLTIFIGIVFIMAVIISVAFRKVVATNMVHIVQSKKKTTSYGSEGTAGNVYYSWPSWVPFIGVTRIMLPVSNFDLSLKDYEAYDKDRVPFQVDVTAFFRIHDTTVAAKRVAGLEELKEQLHLIVQGAVRKVLASDVINSIMLERAKFGELFTSEVKEQLAEWGVQSVKSMELMDIRDGHGGNAITNIMAMKTSHIEMESRKEVANNKRLGKTAEIEAEQAVSIREQESQQMVGQRTAEKEKAVGISQQQSQQEVLQQERVTREHSMAVKRVEQVRQAEITKEQKVVEAEQDKQTTIVIAEGQLEQTKRRAEGVRTEGQAKADAEKAMQLAPVEAQIVLAKEIGTNPGYQSYLVSVKAVEAYSAVGSEQAKALTKAEVKVIANTGGVVSGVQSAMDLVSPTGGLALGGMLEALGNTDQGKALLGALGTRLASTAPPKPMGESGAKGADEAQ